MFIVCIYYALVGVYYFENLHQSLKVIHKGNVPHTIHKVYNNATHLRRKFHSLEYRANPNFNKLVEGIMCRFLW